MRKIALTMLSVVWIVTFAFAWEMGDPIVYTSAAPGYPGHPQRLTELVAKQMKAAGYNLIYVSSLADLDLAQKYGLRGVCSLNPKGGRFLPADGSPEYADAEERVRSVMNHPALYAYRLYDEPSAGLFKKLARIRTWVQGIDPAHPIWVNLLPTYANSKQLGVSGESISAYWEHVRLWCETYRPELLSYDHYQFQTKGDSPNYFLNLGIIRNYASANAIPFVNIVQACTWWPSGKLASPRSPRIPTADELRYLVYTTLAYGAEGIGYYVYSYPGHTGSIMGMDGTPGALYGPVSEYNRAFVSIAKELRKYKFAGAYFQGVQAPGTTPYCDEAILKLAPEAPTRELGEDGRMVDSTLVSRFDGADGSHAFVVVNLDYCKDRTIEVSAPAELELFDEKTSRWRSVGLCAKLEFAKGGGVLLRLVPCPALKFGRIDRTKFHIFSSVQAPMTFNREDEIKAVAECGIDLFSACFSDEGLDICRKYGIGAIDRGLLPQWWGGHADKNGHMHELRPVEEFERLIKTRKPHPALVAFEFGDEPSALDFEHCGKIAAAIGKYADAYLNLFPNYATSGSLGMPATKSQLGTESYEEYLEQYCKYVPIDEICFDNYCFAWKNKPGRLFENLRIAANAAQSSRKSLTVELQAKTYCNEKGEKGVEMTANRLRYQCNAALSFGARQIDWINFSSVWWTDHVMDREGNIVNRPLFERLKVVNQELRRQGDVLVGFDRTHTDFVCFGGSPEIRFETVNAISLSSSSGAAFCDVRPQDGKELLVGHFVSRASDGKCALCVMAAEDPQDANETEREIHFRSPYGNLQAIGSDGPIALAKVGSDEYMFSVRSSRAVVIIGEPPPRRW